MHWLILSLGVLGLEPTPPADAPREKAPMSDVARGNNQFALDLYAKLRATPGNRFFSPYSISSALAMTRVGARGETGQEIDRVLHLGPDLAATNQGFAALTSALNGGPSDRPYRLDVANRLWGMEGFHFVDEFLRTTEANYQAGLERVDFRDSARAVAAINAWVAGKTQDKIPKLLEPGDVNAATRLVLTNAIYFKGDWSDPFEKANTSDLLFHVSATEKPQVPTMGRGGQYDFYAGDGLKAIRMPYLPGDLAMEVYLPDAADGLPALEAKLTTENLSRWSGELKRRKVFVLLPKFTMRTRAELMPPLAALGMGRAFNPDQADFSGIATDGKLSISAVIHEAYVAVDEKGTEAAAATAVVMRMTAAMPTEPPVEFRADHPFLFLIRDLKTDAILFLGRVTDPRS